MRGFSQVKPSGLDSPGPPGAAGIREVRGTIAKLRAGSFRFFVVWVLWGVLGLLPSPTLLGQVELEEIPLEPRVLEPGKHDLNDFIEVFRFRLTDVDPLADDGNDVTIRCFLVQNLGTANELEITDVQLRDEQGFPILSAATAPPADILDTGTCPAGAPAVSPVTFEAFLVPPPQAQEGIADDQSVVYQLAVRTAATGVLRDGAQGKTVRLRVTIRLAEEAGNPPEFSVFDISLTDSTPDRVFNGGINELRPLTFPPFPIAPGETGVVSRFQVCDEDSNAYPLRLEELVIGQGPLGSAVVEDFSAFELWEISGTGSPLKWGEVTSGDTAWGSDFNRGGPGIPLPVEPPFLIPDDACKDFEIRAIASPTAMIGRTVHLWVRFTAKEPPEAPTVIDPSVAPTLQTAESVMLGSGVLRIPEVFASGGTVPLEVVGFPAEGLGRIEIQTNSVQFDPNVIRIEGVEPVAPYQVEDVSVDNRRGLLRFSLAIDPQQVGEAATGIPLPEEVARLQITPRGRPGERSPLILQVDRIEDAQGNDVTARVLVISGGVTLLPPGDVDRADGRPTVRDALLLAEALLGCLDDPPAIVGLTDEQKRIADVAEPKAPPGEVPDCTTLTSADMAEIAKLALLEGSQIGRKPDSASGVPDPSEWPLEIPSVRLHCEGSLSICRLRLKGHGIQAVRVALFDSAGKRLATWEGRGQGESLLRPIRMGARPRANGVYLAVVEVRGINGYVSRTAFKVLYLR